MKNKFEIYRISLFLLLICSFLAYTNDSISQKIENQKSIYIDKDKLYIINQKEQVAEFFVEVADTKEKRERGLMYRDSLNLKEGMLFDFKVPKKVSFWMKNTYIPLDIIFINKNGYIVKTYENAVPLSIESIESKYIVRAVLEINSGLIKKFNINTGDRVVYKIFE